ncbi:MAG TPA: DNA primase [Candidatus Limnocylindria bacterium]|nr:DNA primase [Candidatus Limnocylindria bacterium]
MTTNSARTIRHGADDWVERVRSASDLIEVVGQSVALRRAGRNWVGLCPFHQEKTPSFSVNAERQFYHCFSCKVGGDVFKFVQESEKVGFLEAVEMLSRRAGIPVPERRTGGWGARSGVLEALEQAAALYEQWLADPERGRTTRAYLDRRGIARDTVKQFRLGLAPEGWTHVSERLQSRLGEAVLIEAGLVMRRTVAAEGTARTGVYDRFRHRLMVPLVAVGGAVIGFGARALGDEPPKYLNSPETPLYRKGSFLFALELARKAAAAQEELVVVEGYFDVIALHQAGIHNVVATSGTALTGDQARLLKRVTPRVALTYDGDAAGQDAMLRSLGTLFAEGLDVVVVDLPAGSDPDTLVGEQGAEGWHRARAGAYDPVEFVQRHVLRETGAAGDPRERALQAVVRLAADVRDPVREAMLLEHASRVFGFSAAVLGRAVRLRRSGQRSESPLQVAVRRERRTEQVAEHHLLAALLHAPEGLAGAREQITPGDFLDPTARALADWLWAGNQGWPEANETAALARELFASGPETLDWMAEATGATRKLVERRLRRRLREREQQLKRAAEGDETSRLMQEIHEIARSLHELTA